MSYRHRHKQKFDLLIIAMAIQQSMMTPVELAFNPKELNSVYFKIYEYFVDVIFLVDMLLMFFTSFQNKKGQEIKDSQEIAINYILSPRFYCDLFALLSSQFFVFISPTFKVFAFFKMFRIQKLSLFINLLNMPEDMKAFLNFFKLTLHLIMYLNI